MPPQPTGTPPAAFLITGISASGKSTAAQALAAQLPRSVHLRGDTFRRMIVNDRAHMRPEGDQAALDQLRLRHKLTAQALDTYSAAGFAVVAQDVVLGPLLPELIAEVHSSPCRRRPRPSSARGTSARGRSIQDRLHGLDS